MTARRQTDQVPGLSYDPESGRFYRERIGGRGNWREGLVKENFSGQGYLTVSVGQSRFLAHRLAWLIMTGEDRGLDLPLDHINGIRSDNRWSNLRGATSALNAQNRGLGKNNTSAVLGVCRDIQSGKWKARINLSGKQRSSLHVCFGGAVKARKKYELEYFDPSFIGSHRHAFSGEVR